MLKKGFVKLFKVRGAETPADIHTKALTRREFEAMLKLMDIKEFPQYAIDAEEAKCLHMFKYMKLLY